MTNKIDKVQERFMGRSHNLKAAGSNPAPATNYFKYLFKVGLFKFFRRFSSGTPQAYFIAAGIYPNTLQPICESPQSPKDITIVRVQVIA
jgi:hypothetical protein